MNFTENNMKTIFRQNFVTIGVCGRSTKKCWAEAHPF
jgi:hypothetical protein